MIRTESHVGHHDFTKVHNALSEYYKAHLEVRRLSGESIDLEKCHVNLAIVVVLHQHEINRVQLNEQTKSFIRMESYEKVVGTKIESTIQIEDIFNKRRLRDGRNNIPKKILIQGRAGIGKTTFCKKLVHQFISGKWHDRFEAVIWIPLRQLKKLKSRNLVDLIKEKYFTYHSDHDKLNLTHKLNEAIEHGKVLFILDGLDEIIHDARTDTIMRLFVKHLLQQTHVIITSRPSGIDYSLLPTFDLEFETVGFSTTNVSDYLTNVLDGKVAISVMEFIKKTPIIQSLANIPVQLDIICYCQESLLKYPGIITLTMLYQSMVNHIWRIWIEKLDNGNATSIGPMKGPGGQQVSHLISTEMEYLSYLAFIGMESNRIEFDNATMKDAVEKLNQSREYTSRDRLPLDFLDNLKQKLFLHSVEDNLDSQQDLTQQSYRFIHLTFQEFFAAMWLSKYFQIQTSNPSTTSTLMNGDEAITFIQKHKYNPRYEIVWWMIAGQLEGEALESYFQLLQAAPRDLIGVRHQYLIAGCYNEARHRLSNKLVKQIRSELMQWLHFEMTIPGYRYLNSVMGRQSTFPEDILIECIDGFKDGTRHLLEALAYRRYLLPSTVDHLLQMTTDIDSDVAYSALWVISKQSTLPESTITALFTALQYETMNIRLGAIDAICSQSTLSESTIAALVAALYSFDVDIRYNVVEALGNHSTMSESILSALITALGDEEFFVRQLSARKLGNQSVMQESTIQALITTLKDEDEMVRQAAVEALGKQSKISESTITALFTALQDKDTFTRRAAAQALGKHSVLFESTTEGFITALQSEKWFVKYAAVKALGKQSTLSESIITSVVSALLDEDSNVRVVAAEALGNQSTLSESVKSALATALEDGNWEVREASACALGNQYTLSESIITALVNTLQDKHERVRTMAALAIGNQQGLSESAVTALIAVLRDKNFYVRQSAADAIGKQSRSESTMTILVGALHDKHSIVRHAAAYALSKQSTLLESTTTALCTALQDEYVQSAAVLALGKQSTLSESTLSRIITSSNGKDISKPLTGVLGDPRFYFCVKDLTDNDIEVLYKQAILSYSCYHHVALFIHEKRLSIYTEQGFDQTEELSDEVLQKIESVFKTVQRNGGVGVNPPLGSRQKIEPALLVDRWSGRIAPNYILVSQQKMEPALQVNTVYRVTPLNHHLVSQQQMNPALIGRRRTPPNYNPISQQKKKERFGSKCKILFKKMFTETKDEK
ncbi:hypothetical protein BGZ76_004042 [Entomortierella beljakovae]|nr:hypothetical protein BGZ76_004042 [Entomortierella beljakovae]